MDCINHLQMAGLLCIGTQFSRTRAPRWSATQPVVSIGHERLYLSLKARLVLQGRRSGSVQCVMHSIRQGSHMWWIVFFFYCIIDVIVIYVHMIIISNQLFSVCGVSAGEMAEGGLFVCDSSSSATANTSCTSESKGLWNVLGTSLDPDPWCQWCKCGNIYEKG